MVEACSRKHLLPIFHWQLTTSAIFAGCIQVLQERHLEIDEDTICLPFPRTIRCRWTNYSMELPNSHGCMETAPALAAVTVSY